MNTLSDWSATLVVIASGGDEMSDHAVSVSFEMNFRDETIGADLQRGLAAVRSLIVAGAVLCSSELAHAQAPTVEAGIAFDIHAQSLADALVAYGAATKLDVFYDGSLALGRRSTAIKGTYTSSRGLQELLRGTGFTGKRTALPDTVTITMVTAAPIAPSALDPFEPFFAVLQARIGETLCQTAHTGPDGEQVLFSLWFDPAGMVTRAEVLGSAGSRMRRIAIATRGLRIGVRPPPGLPQPVTMAIFAPMAGEATGCATSGSRHAAR